MLTRFFAKISNCPKLLVALKLVHIIYKIAYMNIIYEYTYESIALHSFKAFYNPTNGHMPYSKLDKITGIFPLEFV